VTHGVVGRRRDSYRRGHRVSAERVWFAGVHAERHGPRFVADQLNAAPGDVVEPLLLAASSREAEILAIAPGGPFTERRSFRVSDEGAAVLRSSGAPSWFGRQVLAYFLGNRSALREALKTQVPADARNPMPVIIILGVCAVLFLAAWYLWLWPTNEAEQGST